MMGAGNAEGWGNLAALLMMFVKAEGSGAEGVEAKLLLPERGDATLMKSEGMGPKALFKNGSGGVPKVNAPPPSSCSPPKLLPRLDLLSPCAIPGPPPLSLPLRLLVVLEEALTPATPPDLTLDTPAPGMEGHQPVLLGDEGVGGKE